MKHIKQYIPLNEAYINRGPEAVRILELLLDNTENNVISWKHMGRPMLTEQVDISNVDITGEEDNQTVDWVIDQVKRATGEEIVSIEGECGGGGWHLVLDLSDGSEIFTRYTDSPYPTSTSGYIFVEYSNGSVKIRKKDTDTGVKDILDAGEEIYGMLKVILREAYPNYSIYYSEMDDDLGIAQISLTFKSREAAEAWVESLHDQIEEVSQ